LISRLFAVATTLMVVGCAATQYSSFSDDPDVFEEHVRNVSKVDSWEIHARLGYQTGARGGSGSLIWKRDQNRHEVDIFGSFGENRLRIAQDDDGAVLTDSKGTYMTGRSIDELLYARIGWTLPPIADLENWIVGIPQAQSAEKIRWNGLGQVISFRQSGWKIRCFDYRQSGTYAFPSQVRVASASYDPLGRVHRDPGEVQPIEVRLSIRKWGVL